MTDDLVWATLLLFALSLVPFATADLGEDHVERAATRSYFVVLLLPVAGYVWLQAVIRHTDARGETASLYRRRTMRKGLACGGLYLTGLALRRSRRSSASPRRRWSRCCGSCPTVASIAGSRPDRAIRR